MDRIQLIYDVIRAYIVVLVFSLSLLLVGVVFAGEFEYRVVTLIWYQLTGIGILLAVTYRTFQQSEISLTTVGILFLAWTAFLESLFIIYSRPGPLSGPEKPGASGYATLLLNNIKFLVLLLVILLISGVLFVVAIYFIRMVYSYIDSPITKGILYPMTFGIIIADIIGIALLIPSLPDTFPELSVAVAIWLKTTIFSVGGLGDWFSAHFTLTGINYYFLWVGIDLAVAWTFTLFDVTSSRLTDYHGTIR